MSGKAPQPTYHTCKTLKKARQIPPNLFSVGKGFIIAINYSVVKLDKLKFLSNWFITGSLKTKRTKHSWPLLISTYSFENRL